MLNSIFALLNRVPKDKLLHVVLVSIIVVLLGTSIYFRATRRNNASQYEFLSKIDELEAEQELQLAPVKALPPPADAIKVPILIYHSISPHNINQSAIQKYYDVAPESFEKQLQYLRDNGYTVLGLDFLADALTQTITLPQKSVVLTFDDGWENQFQRAYPLLKKYNYTATFFIFTHSIDSESFLTWDQIRTMDDGGMTIGGHTRTHPYLPGITDPVILRREIIGGKSVLENRIGHAIDLFAYPYGHYTDQIIEIVKEAGYKAARSAYKGVYHTSDDLYKLRGIEATDDFDNFVRDLNG